MQKGNVTHRFWRQVTIFSFCQYGTNSSHNFVAEAAKQEEINKAEGAAKALVSIAESRAKSLKLVANALNIADAKNAAALSIAEQYVKAFNKLAKNNNTLILPSNVGDVSSLVSQVCCNKDLCFYLLFYIQLYLK